MGMTVGQEQDDDTPMSAINVVPLVDVMLVMLIIFILTVPVVIQTVPLRLPETSSTPTTTKPENVLISVNADGDIFWGIQRLDSKQALFDKGVSHLRAEIERQEKAGVPIELPEVHIRGDAGTEYSNIGGVIFTMQRAGFVKVGFISEPQMGTVTR
jgi:biopolymer transport protein ExbD